MTKIALDAGHWYGEPGRRCLKKFDKNETREWTLNSRVIEYVEDGLKDYTGYEYIRVDDRTGKKNVSLAQRVKLANDFKADVFLSVHHNAGIKGGKGGGIVVYRYPNSTKFTKAMQKALYDSLIDHTGLRGNRANPLAEANFIVLRDTKMAAVLIENGFMDSKTDVPIILSDAHAKKSARAIVEWIAEHYKLTLKPKPKIEVDKGTYYRVVTGSYNDRDNAVKQQAKLKKAGFDSFLSIYNK